MSFALTISEKAGYKSKTLTITEKRMTTTGTPSSTPAMDFSIVANSMYVATISM